MNLIKETSKINISQTTCFVINGRYHPWETTEARRLAWQCTLAPSGLMRKQEHGIFFEISWSLVFRMINSTLRGVHFYQVNLYACDIRENNFATNQAQKPEIKPEICFADVNDGKKWSSLIYNFRKTSGLDIQQESSGLLFMW